MRKYSLKVFKFNEETAFYEVDYVEHFEKEKVSHAKMFARRHAATNGYEEFEQYGNREYINVDRRRAGTFIWVLLTDKHTVVDYVTMKPIALYRLVIERIN